ncbi:AraC family ligand binding domain-containing protein [Zavarzinia compransoris]|uniref:Ethanolamine utilization protein EutQ n=1 Tax=Zavarzinia compransoris TaxID=1264899 RepID=A0A317E5K5_9PROT|nr:AraC family ligand binding domain-containing protein [Zavarzinia compransoris]PWR21882.1 ethanolamine utilization protein EutQ [Zavarzinia compransoris]TDP45312.1 ethanolamine utilization protein EutQ [Zavarzinia compransoris]
MAGVRCFPAGSRAFAPYIDNAEIAKLIGPEVSSTMGAGVVTYRRLSAPWSLPFDEVVIVLAGAMRVVSDGAVHEAGPGDVLFFPKETPLTYEVDDEVTLFYVKYPVGLTAPIP